MQYDAVVAERVELQLFDLRHQDRSVVRLLDYAEAEYEDRVVVIDRRQTMIAALIDENDIVTMHLLFFRLPRKLAIKQTSECARYGETSVVADPQEEMLLLQESLP